MDRDAAGGIQVQWDDRSTMQQVAKLEGVRQQGRQRVTGDLGFGVLKTWGDTDNYLESHSERAIFHNLGHLQCEKFFFLVGKANLRTSSSSPPPPLTIGRCKETAGMWALDAARLNWICGISGPWDPRKHHQAPA